MIDCAPSAATPSGARYSWPAPRNPTDRVAFPDQPIHANSCVHLNATGCRSTSNQRLVEPFSTLPQTWRTGSETFCNASVGLNPSRNKIELRGNGNRRAFHRDPGVARRLRPPTSGPLRTVFPSEIEPFRIGVPRTRFDQHNCERRTSYTTSDD
jgi:hypothetical protein